MNLDLEKSIGFLRKSEVSVDKISFCNVIENLAGNAMLLYQ